MSVRLELKIKNAALFNVAVKQCGSVAAFCREHGESCSLVGDLINLKVSPMRARGGYRFVCQRIAGKVGILVEDLFPVDLYNRFLGDSHRIAEVPMSVLPPTDPVLQIEAPQDDDVVQREMKEHITAAMAGLTRREAVVTVSRLEGRTLQELADKLQVTHERIRQIEMKAHRKLYKRLSASHAYELIGNQ